jgi:hypothetical protein
MKAIVVSSEVKGGADQVKSSNTSPQGSRTRRSKTSSKWGSTPLPPFTRPAFDNPGARHYRLPAMHAILRILPAVILLVTSYGVIAVHVSAAEEVPFKTVFKGRERFDRLLKDGRAKDWKSLPIGMRTGTVGMALLGTPYRHSTLEIDPRVEAVSVNFNGMDCWTFFETSLAFARLLTLPEEQQTPSMMLRLLELDRYRDGRCTGDYLSRHHFLETWIRDNARRGLVADITESLGGVRMPHHDVCEMSDSRNLYPALKNNEKMVERIREVEEEVSDLKVLYIPKSQVPRVEKQLENGDIICVTTRASESYTSHVGLAWRDQKGVLRLLHATTNRDVGERENAGRRVVLDERLSDYLDRIPRHAGIYVARPNDLPPEVVAELTAVQKEKN